MFSSPPRGIYISTKTFRWWYERYDCSRPLHGESIYLLKKDHPMPPLAFVLVPSTGNLYIYYLQERADYLSELFSSPPRGIYISTNIVHGQLCSILFSSPPRGIYISTNTCIFVHALVISSRPLHGESIYLPNWVRTKVQGLICSRPIHGESIYLRYSLEVPIACLSVLVPSTGNLYIYLWGSGAVVAHWSVLVPSTGNLYIYQMQLIR